MAVASMYNELESSFGQSAHLGTNLCSQLQYLVRGALVASRHAQTWRQVGGRLEAGCSDAPNLPPRCLPDASQMPPRCLDLPLEI